jgi:hypothetical protein
MPLQRRFPKEPNHCRAVDDSQTAKKPQASNVIRLEIERVKGVRGSGSWPPSECHRSAPQGFMHSKYGLGSSTDPAGCTTTPHH